MTNFFGYQRRIPLVLPGCAPFFPQPHSVERIRMLMAGTDHGCSH